MNRKVLLFYYIISIVFLLVLLLFAAWRTKSLWDRNEKAVRDAFSDLKVGALSTFLAEGSMESEYFKYNMKQQLSLMGRLQLMSIYSREQGIQYLLARRGGYLAVPPDSTEGWKGEPEYRLLPLFERRLTAPFTAALNLDAVFRLLEPTDLHPVLLELFYMLLVYLVITAVVLLAVTAERPARGAIAETFRQPRRAAAVQDAAAPAQKPFGLTSPHSGLVWKEHLAARLSHELERAASFDQDLTLLLTALDPKQPAAAKDYDFRRLASLALESFPFKDLAFEYDGRTCAVIQPDRDLALALKDARAFRKKLAQAPWAGGRRPRISMGLSARNGRLINATRLLLEASKALARAESAGAGSIVAFQADPTKFRETLSSGATSASAPRGSAGRL